MDNMEAIAALAALAQPTRLDTFRLLVKKEPEGVPAGELARLIATVDPPVRGQRFLDFVTQDSLDAVTYPLAANTFS
jgi:DNA-binding transcriptional ArsR family regulator